MLQSQPVAPAHPSASLQMALDHLVESAGLSSNLEEFLTAPERSLQDLTEKAQNPEFEPSVPRQTAKYSHAWL